MGDLATKREAREIAARPDAGAQIEQLLVKGDLGALTPQQRNEYYLALCHATGLNPLTQPFEYLTLNRKLVLYAKKACTDQLRALHKISVVDMDQEEVEGVFTVTVKLQNGDGRTDMDMGSVTIAGLKGDARANAIMKAATKAKRRATLSMCGLGMLDETEVETIPDSVKTLPSGRRTNVVVNEETGRKVDLESANQQKKDGAWERFEDRVQGFVDARDADGLRLWFTSDETSKYVAGWVFKDEAHEHYDKAMDEIAELENA